MIFRVFLTSSLLAGAAVAQTPPAPAPTPAAASDANDPDALCVITMAAVTGAMDRRAASLDEEGRRNHQTLQYAVHYYAGRFGARHPGAAGGAVMLAAGRAFRPSDHQQTGLQCLTDFLAGMQGITEEAQAAVPLTRGPAPAGAPAAPDSQMQCFAVLSHTLSVASRREAELTPELRQALPTLRFSIPFYAGRISVNFAPGTRGPAIATAFRAFAAADNARGATIIGDCLNGVRDQLTVLASAADQLRSGAPGAPR